MLAEIADTLKDDYVFANLQAFMSCHYILVH